MDRIQALIESPELEVTQADGRNPCRARIPEAGGCARRFVLFPNGETGDDAFFNRERRGPRSDSSLPRALP